MLWVLLGVMYRSYKERWPKLSHASVTLSVPILHGPVLAVPCGNQRFHQSPLVKIPEEALASSHVAPPMTRPIFSDTLILNSFPAKVSRDDVKTWLTPLVEKLIGDAEFSISSQRPSH